MKYLYLLFPITIFFSTSSYAVKSTYDLLLTNKKCQEMSNQQLSCRYKAGKTLEVEIAGIGSADAGIVFYKSDFNGDYYGKYGVMHGCVIVSEVHNLLNLAFISPKNGKVYRTWQECADGK